VAAVDIGTVPSGVTAVEVGDASGSVGAAVVVVPTAASELLGPPPLHAHVMAIITSAAAPRPRFITPQ
jgi:hypothetical protein